MIYITSITLSTETIMEPENQVDKNRDSLPNGISKKRLPSEGQKKNN